MDVPDASLLGIPQELRDKIWKNLLVYEQPIRIATVKRSSCPNKTAGATAKVRVSYAKTTYHRRHILPTPAPSALSTSSPSSIYGSGDTLTTILHPAHTRGPLRTCKTPRCNYCSQWRGTDRAHYVWDNYDGLELFFVNKQVYHEASQVFYANNTFHFSLASAKNNDSIQSLAMFLDSRPLHVCKSLRSMSIKLQLDAGREASGPENEVIDWRLMEYLKELLGHSYHIRSLKVTVDGPTFLTDHLQPFKRNAETELERARIIINMFEAFSRVKKLHITVNSANHFTTNKASRDMIRKIASKIEGTIDLKDEDIIHHPNPAHADEDYWRGTFHNFSLKREY